MRPHLRHTVTRALYLKNIVWPTVLTWFFWGWEMLKNPNFPGLRPDRTHWGELTVRAYIRAYISQRWRWQDILVRDYVWKLNKMPEFYMIFARKINKIPEFYTTFARKSVRILHYACPKNIFRDFFFFGGGQPLATVSYARLGPRPPPAKSGPADTWTWQTD